MADTTSSTPDAKPQVPAADLALGAASMGPGAALRQFWRQSMAGLRVFAVATVILGLAYPALILGAGLLLPHQAGGALVNADGGPAAAGDSDLVGSSLLGQSFDGEQWFHGRPSVAGDGYDAMNSAASNLGPNDARLVGEIESRRASIAKEEQVAPELVPVDALTASTSGLDPDISVAYAELQASRVAKVREIPLETVQGLIMDATMEPTLGVGAQRVNVLALNTALERETKIGG